MLTVNQLCDLYLDHCKVYYRKPQSRRPTGETESCRVALQPLRLMAGDLDAAETSASTLAQARQWLLSHTTNSRKTVNAKVGRMVRMFRWACEPERALLPDTVLGRLLALRPLTYGRTTAPEKTGLRTITRDQLNDVLAALAEPPARVQNKVPKSIRLARMRMMTMLELQAETGMRSGELCSMTWEQIRPHPSVPEVWVYRPLEHKTEHHNKPREVAIYQAGQALIRTWMAVSGINTGRLFYITTAGYRTTLQRAMKRAKITRWTPHQVRHLTGTELRRELGIDAAQAQLGHSSVRTTEIYAEVEHEHIVAKIARHRDS